MPSSLLQMQNLTKTYRIGSIMAGRKLNAVDDLTINLPSDGATIVSIVGESGSGKTTLARMILRLIEPTHGDVVLEGRTDLLSKKALPNSEFKKLVQPIFQNPFEAFSSRRKVETYLFATALNLGVAKNRVEAREVVADALENVGLDYDRVIGKYPAQFSGGELQRVSIARALISKPRIIIADEPVAMVDASMKMNIINLFLELKEKFDVSFFYITHDLSTAYYVSDYIAIMYRGSLVEFGPSNEILTSPAHPYTELLMNSVPTIGEKWSEDFAMPDLETKEYGMTACKFAARCAFAKDICRQEKPPMVNFGSGRQALCYRPINYDKNYEAAEGKASGV